jgi:hypothetical protein
VSQDIKRHNAGSIPQTVSLNKKSYEIMSSGIQIQRNQETALARDQWFCLTKPRVENHVKHCAVLDFECVHFFFVYND